MMIVPPPVKSGIVFRSPFTERRRVNHAAGGSCRTVGGARPWGNRCPCCPSCWSITGTAAVGAQSLAGKNSRGKD